MANDIGASLNTYLLAQSGVTAICAQRGHPDHLPKNALLPAFTYEVISETPLHNMGGAAGLREARVQIDCYAGTRKQANELDEAILAALDMQRGTFGGTFCNTIQSESRQSFTEQPIDASDSWRYIATRDYLVFYVP